MTWEISNDDDGFILVGKRGEQISGLDHELARTLRTLLNQYERRRAYADGKVNTFVKDRSLPGEVGEEVAVNRVRLLKLAHKAEQVVEQWADYLAHLEAVLMPPPLPALATIDQAGNVDDSGFRKKTPVLARKIPEDIPPALVVLYGTVQLNIKAYLNFAAKCREELATQYNEED